MNRELRNESLPETIHTEADIVRFIQHLTGTEELNFHPDTPFEDYIKYADGSTSNTPAECVVRNRLLDESFALVGDRIYDIGLQLSLQELIPYLAQSR